MKTIEVVIPTRNRHEKLSQTIESIEKRVLTTPVVKVEIVLIFDGDIKGFSKFKSTGHRCLYLPGHNGAVKCRNSWISKSTADFILYATDDIIFAGAAISNAFDCMLHEFENGNGVVGFMQEGNDKFHPTGVAMVGKEFIDKYPGRQLFNPEYFHFACQEVHWLAVKLNRFHRCGLAVVKHLNPNIDKQHMDTTHHDARIRTKEDHALIAKRITDGLIWGE